jgi:hypothetical protein
MKDLDKCTPIELQKMAEGAKNEHELVKKSIVEDTHKIEELEKSINAKLNELTELEKLYVLIVEEIDKR